MRNKFLGMALLLLTLAAQAPAQADIYMQHPRGGASQPSPSARSGT